MNLYGFVGNDGVCLIDAYGLVKLCCCVKDVSIDPNSIKPKEMADPPELTNMFDGHQFTVNIKLRRDFVVDSTKDCNCKLEWWEWSSEPLPYGKKQARKWVDGAVEAPNSPTIKPWRELGNNDNPLIIDTPSIPIFDKDRFGKTRHLYIFIRVSSGKGCGCSVESKEVRIYQKLTLKDAGYGVGVVDNANSEIKVVDGNFGVGDHGGWPK